jgi:hypothetical protein
MMVKMNEKISFADEVKKERERKHLENILKASE